MEGALKGLFGGGNDNDQDDDRASRARDFITRYEDGDPSEGYSDDEALEYFQQASQHASPEQMQRAYQNSVSRLNPDQRSAFQSMLEERQRQGGRDSGGGLDDMLGGLMGGGGGGGLLGGLLGGGGGGGGLGGMFGGDDDRSTYRSSQRGGGMDGMLGGLMGNAAGKAVMGGIAAYMMKELLGGRR